MDCKSTEQIIELYETQTELKTESLSLFFYFGCSFRGSLGNYSKELSQIYEKVIPDLKSLEFTYIVSFVWSLMNF